MIPITLKDGTPIRDENGDPVLWDPDRRCAVVFRFHSAGGWSNPRTNPLADEAYAGSVPMRELAP